MTYRPPMVFEHNPVIEQDDLTLWSEHMGRVGKGEEEPTIYDQLQVVLNKMQLSPKLGKELNVILVCQVLLDCNKRLSALEAKG